jgi:hypothetical protein
MKNYLQKVVVVKFIAHSAKQSKAEQSRDQ